jgi:hypothetical protein
VRFGEGGTIWGREVAAGVWERGGPLKTFETEEEYKASEHYRQGIKYEQGMTNAAARVLAENFDKRRERERILAAGDANGPWWYGPLGFGAGVIGSLPDPVNFIPFAGGAVKATRLAGMTTRQVAATSLKKGLIEGATGNVVSSGVAAWDLNAKGDHITTREVLLDTMFGAVAGPLLHGAGSFLGRRAARNAMRTDMLTIHDAMPEGGAASARLDNALAGMGRGEAKAYADAAPMLEGLNKDGVIRFLRENTLPSDRLEIARAMEFAIGELVEGRAVDVSPILKESAALGRAWDAVKAEIDARTPAGKPGEVLVLLEPQGQDSMGVQRGPMLEMGGELRATGRAVEGQTGTRAGYGITKVQIEHPDVTRADVLSIPRIMREYEPDASHGAGRTWVVERTDGRQLVIGETKTADGGMLATVHLADPGKERPLSARRKGSSEKLPEGSAPQQRFAAVVSGDTGGGFPPGHTRSPQGEVKIVRPGEAVNSPDAGHGIDFRPETPEAHEPFPPVSKEQASIFEEAASPEEAYLASLEAEGKLSQADKEAFLVHNEETARINALEE